MSSTSVQFKDWGIATVAARPGGVVFAALDEASGDVRGYAEVTLTPEEAFQLSRALVKAAAEALGVKQGDG